MGQDARSGAEREKVLTRTRQQPRRSWHRQTDERLLDLRLRELDLRIEGTALALRIEQLQEELERRGIRFRPHAWLSYEWFSPDGVPGIAVPFYLAHPRLMKLELNQMFEVEGGSKASCMRILRHEAGHAVCTAYRLHRRRRWRELFGRFSETYPKHYTPKPASRKFVQHLDAWYAQAHPAEDFAETFAVCLTPRSRWHQRYETWPVALRKLRYVEELIDDIAGKPAPVRSRRRIDPLGQLTMTLREHYRKRAAKYSKALPVVFDRDLRRLFSDDPRYRRRPAAETVLRGLRREIRDTVAEWTGRHPYSVDQVLQVVINRCQRLELRLARPRRLARTHALALLMLLNMRSRKLEIAL